MSKKKKHKKSGNQDRYVQTIILITAILNLITTVANFILLLLD